jgi:hypothetical protein
MQKTLLSLAAIAAVAAQLSAQCVAPTGTQTLETTFNGTTFYANTTAPLYGVSVDPGVAVRCDMAVTGNINLTSVGTNFLNDGGTYAGIVVPNLVGSPNGTCEVWVVPNDTVLNATLFTNNLYTHNPSVPPIAPWQLLSSQATHISNLVFAAPDTPSTATFNPPLALTPGNYAVVFVFVPKGVATIPAGTGVAANPATDRIHPLFTNMNTQPTPSTFADGFITLSNIGVISPAFANGALSPASATPYMPNLSVGYSVGAGAAYQTPYGVGCYDRKQAFYESWTGGTTMDIDNVGGINGLDMFNIGTNYIVTATTLPESPLWKDLPASDVLCLVPRPSTPAARDAKQLIVAWDRATSLPIAVVRDSTEGDRTIARLRSVEVGPLNDADRALVDLPAAAEGWTVDRRPLKP